MKVLFLVNHEIVIYNFRKELVLSLLNQGYDVTISSPNGPRIKELINYGVGYEQIEILRHSFNPVIELKLLLNYYKLLKKIKPDIILSYTIKPNMFGTIAASILKIPILINITGLGDALHKDGFRKYILLKIYKYVLKKSYCVFFQNKDNYNYFNDLFSISNKSVILPGSGVNLSEFRFTEYPNNNKIKILYYGRIMKSKGILEYLDAIKAISKLFDNIIFIFVGFFENDNIKNLFMNYKEIYDIEYHEYTTNVIPYIVTADAIILPSHHEGMSNSLLEAAALGRPLLASNIPGCKEIVEDGKNGFLFKPYSAISIKQAITKFVNLSFEDRQLMGRYSRIKVENEFNRNIVVEKYIEIIKKVESEYKENERFSN